MVMYTRECGGLCIGGITGERSELGRRREVEQDAGADLFTNCAWSVEYCRCVKYNGVNGCMGGIKGIGD